MRIKMSEMVVFGLFVILAVIAYQYSDEAARAWAERRQQPSIVYAVPTPQAVPVQVVQPEPLPVYLAQPTPAVEVTIAAYYTQQAEYVQPVQQFERGGWEAATPEGSTGVHDPGRSDKRSTAAP
jgi:hypothetical protein